MKVLIAPDKFKGSLSAAQVAAHLRSGLADAGIRTVELPVADGGDGTVDAVVGAGSARHAVTVDGPVPGGRTRADWAFDGNTAVVEVANTCGLALLDDLTPLDASSYGFGQAVRAALAHRPTRLVLALGGSSSTDAGMGLFAALGMRFVDHTGRTVEPAGGRVLADVASVDWSGLIDLGATELVVATDVANPLLGARGAASVFGPQKGATPTQVRLLERGVSNFVRALAGAGRCAREVEVAAATPGAGAAGGLGFAAMLLGATVRSGADFVLDLVGFDDIVSGCDVVVTGEGRMDAQTLEGKLPARVLARSGPRPVHAVVGRCDLTQSPFAGVIAIGDRTTADPARDPQLTASLLRAAGRELAAALGVDGPRAPARQQPGYGVKPSSVMTFEVTTHRTS